MKELHIGKKINQVLEEKGLSITEFAKRINKSRENAYSIFKRKSIDTALLQQISEVLDFDFFSLYTTPNKDTEHLIEENRMLREMNELLKKNQAIADLKGKLDDLINHLKEVYETKKSKGKGRLKKVLG